MPEPALLLGPIGIIATNPTGAAMAEDPRALAELVRMAKTVIRAKTAGRCIVPVFMNGRHVLIEVDVAPWGAVHALTLGRDVTVSTGIQEALTISRERYRGLLEIAVDCIWETGTDGGPGIAGAEHDLRPPG